VTTPPSRRPRSWDGEGEVLGERRLMLTFCIDSTRAFITEVGEGLGVETKPSADRGERRL
jgi:hypothetical protein